MIEPTCGRIIEPFVRAMASHPDMPDVQIIGGNGSAALLDRRTVIDLDRRTIIAPASCDLPRYRADGTLRDLDALVLSTDQRRIDSVEIMAEELIDDRLAVSIFGLKPLADLERQRVRPLRSTASVFLGDRYVTTTRDCSGRLVDVRGFKALFPFRVPIGFDAIETFQLHLGDGPATPTAHPGATILNYLTRSISGLRAKDREKVDTMTEHVLAGCPEVAAWITDGPGRGLLELARILHTLRQPRNAPYTLRIGGRLEVARTPRTSWRTTRGTWSTSSARRVGGPSSSWLVSSRGSSEAPRVTLGWSRRGNVTSSIGSEPSSTTSRPATMAEQHEPARGPGSVEVEGGGGLMRHLDEPLDGGDGGGTPRPGR